jgi:2-hydroxy-3-oxopropionate reductase
MANLGFIGLGSMGAPMAANLLAAGHALAVHARRPEAMEPLVAAGAAACASPRDVAARSDVIFTMVTDTGAVEEVALGSDGIVAGARPGSVLIDHSTIPPSGARRIATSLRTHGIHMLDAPVSGGCAGARAATLSIMVGGDEDVFDRSRPLLESLGTTVVYIGGAGAGQVAKACNQICIVVNQLGAAEALLLAERSGVDFDRVKRALMGGFAASRILDVQAPKMMSRRFEGQIESRLHHKDILIALEMARELGARLPASSLAANLLTRLQEAGGAKLDSAAVFTILEQASRQEPREQAAD